MEDEAMYSEDLIGSVEKRQGTLSSSQGYLVLLEQLEHAFDKVATLVVNEEITDVQCVIRFGKNKLKLTDFLNLFNDVDKLVTFSVWYQLNGLSENIGHVVTYMTYAEAAYILWDHLQP